MYVLNITNDFDGLTNNTQIIDDGNDNFFIILKLLLLAITGSVLLISLIGLIVWPTLKPLFS